MHKSYHTPKCFCDQKIKCTIIIEHFLTFKKKQKSFKVYLYIFRTQNTLKCYAGKKYLVMDKPKRVRNGLLWFCGVSVFIFSLWLLIHRETERTRGNIKTQREPKRKRNIKTWREREREREREKRRKRIRERTGLRDAWVWSGRPG